MDISIDVVEGTFSSCDKLINAYAIYFVKPQTKRPLGWSFGGTILLKKVLQKAR